MVVTCALPVGRNWGLSTSSVSAHSNVRRATEKNDNDDIQIPSIGRMFDIIKADDMFNLLEIVDNMAFFRRSKAPLIDPQSDSWWLQGYNKAYYKEIQPWGPRLPRVQSCLACITPQSLKKIIPVRLKKMLWQRK